MKLRKILLATGIALLVILISVIIFIYPVFKSMMHEETMQIDNNLTLVLGGGGNSGILITDSALVVIDTKMSKPAKSLYELATKKAGSLPIIVINTHFHGDHVNGNYQYKGDKIYMGAYDREFINKNIKPEDLPTTLVKDSLLLNLGNESLLLVNLGQAHTFDDMIVYLMKRKILFSGDLVQNKTNPFLVKDSGADVDKWIMALARIIHNFDGQMIVPGHGKPGDKQLAMSMVQYFDDMKQAASDPVKKKELIAKYAAWKKIPVMASPEITIKYIKEK